MVDALWRECRAAHDHLQRTLGDDFQRAFDGANAPAYAARLARTELPDDLSVGARRRAADRRVQVDDLDLGVTGKLREDRQRVR